MNKKGFTLIELLGVILIISLLVIIVLPKITNSVNNFSTKTDNLMLQMIKDAAKLYVEDNENEFPKKVNNSYCVTINKLVENNYLKGMVEIEGEDITNTKILQITYSNNYNIEIVNSDTCIDYRDICKPVTEETKTTGNIPNGNFELGDEYICEVKPKTTYRFFVISVENDKVNLIMDRNINSDGTLATETISPSNAINGIYSAVAWISAKDYNTANVDNTSCEFDGCNDEGPITAMRFLDNATNSWIYIPKLNDEYEDKIYGVIEFKSRARLPKSLEVVETGCGKTSSDVGGCPLWMVNYLYNSSYNGEPRIPIGSMYGYWFLSANGQGKNVVYLWFDGFINSASATFDENIGIRPIISLPKNYLVN